MSIVYKTSFAKFEFPQAIRCLRNLEDDGELELVSVIPPKNPKADERCGEGHLTLPTKVEGTKKNQIEARSFERSLRSNVRRSCMRGVYRMVYAYRVTPETKDAYWLLGEDALRWRNLRMKYRNGGSGFKFRCGHFQLISNGKLVDFYRRVYHVHTNGPREFFGDPAYWIIPFVLVAYYGSYQPELCINLKHGNAKVTPQKKNTLRIRSLVSEFSPGKTPSKGTPPVPVVPPTSCNEPVLEIELTDDDSDIEDFQQKPTANPPARTATGSHQSPMTQQGRVAIALENSITPEILEITQNVLLAVPTSSKIVAANTFPSSRTTVVQKDNTVNNDGWKILMKRMQQNQKIVLEKNSSKGNKRNLKSPFPSPAQGLETSIQLCKVPVPLPESKKQILTSPPTALKFPIGSGFQKGSMASTYSDTNSPTLPLLFCSSTFNHDNEDYSHVIGWEDTKPIPVELNETSLTNFKERVSKKSCPFYKKIPGTKFSVDAFNYGVIPDIDVYFLSHFHSDHYIGLSKNFSKTLICDFGTGNLVNMKLGVTENCIRRLQLNQVYLIQGVKVVLITANHCPGSVMFLLRLQNGTTIFHTGDFRYTPEMLLNPFLRSFPVDCLYLDTTYCDPKYNFPRQRDSISQVLTVVKQFLNRKPQTLIVCGAYCIGKERVFFSIAEAIQTKVFCAPDKLKMLHEFYNSKYNFYLTNNETLSQIHVLPMRSLHPKCLSDYLAHRKSIYTNLIAIKPSGWEFSHSAQGFSSRTYYGETVTVIGIPYSEHSSFSELQDFVKAINPKRVQPTVGIGNEAKRNEMMSYICSWMNPRSSSY